MRGLTDVARFRAEDPDELVSASLACPLCLRARQVEWELEADNEGYDASVRCECGGCRRGWRVYIAPHQALRLSLLAAHVR
jgi:hypothetical protein